MPLSKARDRERKREARLERANVQPKADHFPEFVQPNRYLQAHVRVYPEYESLLRAGRYNPDRDPFINPLIRSFQPKLGITQEVFQPNEVPAFQPNEVPAFQPNEVPAFQPNEVPELDADGEIIPEYY